MRNAIEKNWGPATRSGVLLYATLHSCAKAVRALSNDVGDYGLIKQM